MESLLVGLKKVALNRLRLQKQVTWVKAVIARRGHWHKSPMGTVSPVSTPFLPGREKKRGSEVKKLLQICWKLGNKKLIGWRSSLHEDFVCVKTPMGLGRFEVRFFSGGKFTKFDLALTRVIKNHSKLGYTRSMMFLRIWLKDFFSVKSFMGTPLDWKFFTLKKKISLPFTPRPNKSSKKKFLRIGYKIPWTYVLPILKSFDPHQKSYGFKRLILNGVFVRRPEKSRFKSAEISAASNMGVGSYC